MSTSTYGKYTVKPGTWFFETSTPEGSYFRSMYGNSSTSTTPRPIQWVSEFKTSTNEGKFIPNTYSQNPYFVGQCRAEKISLQTSTFSAFSDQPSWCGTVLKTVKVNGPGSFFYTIANVLPEIGMKAATTSYSVVNRVKLQEKAITKAYGNLLKPDFAGLSELGEIKETLDFIRHPMFNLVKLLEPKDYLSMRQYKHLLRKVGQITNASRSAKSWNWARWARELPDAAVDDWLRLRYAIRPAVISLTQALKTLDKKRKAFDSNAIRCARSKFVDTESGRVKLDGFKSNKGIYYTKTPLVISEKATLLARRESVVRGGIHYKLKAMPSELARWGLDWKYLPETVWELTRFSFMIDWIIDVGSFIESFRFNPEVEILGNFAGIKTRAVINSSSLMEYKLDPAYGPLNRWEFNPRPMRSTMKTVIETYDRAINVHRQVCPTFGTGIDLCKSADILAILWRPLTQVSKIKT